MEECCQFTHPSVMERWCCEKCGKEFSRKDNLKRHMKACLEKHGHLCISGKAFSRKDNLKRHFKSYQGEQQHGGGDEKGSADKKMEKKEEAGLRPTKEKQEPEASGQELWPSNNGDEDDQLLVRVLDAVEKQLKQDQDQEQDDKIKFK